jgi:DHA2 family multidrug resistance protein
MDPRILISIGFCVFGGCAYWFSLFNIGIGFWSLFWPILISGLGLAMIFSPLAGITLGTLPEEQLGNGSALFNLVRNVGGSIGISFVNTIAARHLQTHTNELSRSLVGTRHVVQNEVSALTSAMTRHAGPHLAMQRAYSELAHTLANQAQTMAFADDFRYLAVISMGCAAAVFILKKTKPVVGAG